MTAQDSRGQKPGLLTASPQALGPTPTSPECPPPPSSRQGGPLALPFCRAQQCQAQPVTGSALERGAPSTPLPPLLPPPWPLVRRPREGRGWALPQSHMFARTCLVPTPLLGQAGKGSPHAARTSGLLREPRHTIQMFAMLDAGVRGEHTSGWWLLLMLETRGVFSAEIQGSLAQAGDGGVASGLPAPRTLVCEAGQIQPIRAGTRPKGSGQVS